MVDQKTSSPVILLVGGFGTRLRSVVGDVPKPLAPVGDKPFLERLLVDLSAQSVERVILSAHYGAERFEEFSAGWNSRRKDLRLEVVVEAQPLGTAGALRFVISTLGLKGRVRIGNGDTWIENGYRDLELAALVHGDAATLGLTHVDSVERFGAVSSDAGGRVKAFIEKGGAQGPGWISAGVSSFIAQDLLDFPQGPLSLERDVYPRWLAEGRLYCTRLQGAFKDIGVPDDYRDFVDRFGQD